MGGMKSGGQSGLAYTICFLFKECRPGDRSGCMEKLTVAWESRGLKD